MKRFSLLLALTAFAPGSLATMAHAQIVYSDNFDNGTSKGTAGPGFNNPGLSEGIVVKNFDVIATDVSGSGFFLYEGTNEQPISPTSSLYTSPTFAVTQNTAYNVSFFLTNDNNIANAILQTQINGVTLGLPVSAVGTYQTNGFQQFNFAFNSGAATTAVLSLQDLVATGIGNDFGVDNIQVAAVPAAVPEPGSIALLVGLGVTGAGFLARKRRK